MATHDNILRDFMRICSDKRLRFSSVQRYARASNGVLDASKIAVSFKDDFMLNIYLYDDYSNIIEQCVKLFSKHPHRAMPYFKLRKNTLNNKVKYTLAILRNSYDLALPSRNKLTRCSYGLGDALRRSPELKSVYSTREVYVSFSEYVDYYELHEVEYDKA